MTISVDAGGLPADIVTVDALARLALLARRHGSELRLSNAPVALVELIELAGLSEVLPAEVLRPRSTEPRC